MRNCYSYLVVFFGIASLFLAGCATVQTAENMQVTGDVAKLGQVINVVEVFMIGNIRNSGYSVLWTPMDDKDGIPRIMESKTYRFFPYSYLEIKGEYLVCEGKFPGTIFLNPVEKTP